VKSDRRPGVIGGRPPSSHGSTSASIASPVLEPIRMRVGVPTSSALLAPPMRTSSRCSM
jgi:hypothetical protein